MPASRQLRLLPALGLWLAVTLATAFYANGLGYGGRELAATLAAFALLLAGELLPSAAGVTESVQRFLAAPIAWLLAVPILGAYAIYAVGTGNSTSWHWMIVAAYVLVPLALLSLREGSAPAWNDYLALIAIPIPVKRLWLSGLWPYPDGHAAHLMTVLLGMNVAVAGFLFIRGLDGIGYSLSWSTKQTFHVVAGIVFVAIVDIPAGLALHFLHWAPGHAGWRSFPVTTIGIFFFTAWPEEFVFRGLLQNLLSRSLKNEKWAWMAASVIFGLSHITNGGFPNWRYVLLATFAGICYGWTWRRSGTIFASAIVHTVVDVIWHFLFA
ncbi:MAG TPA: CPBP family intramembrane glutamic endopeptidase [Candidatus Acidoferrales bacterium]|nr:CPBP family intramembrane glutamic endopeptidase [Candidatus Acidoferrales bacterium]